MSIIAPAGKLGKDKKIDCYYTKKPYVVKKISGMQISNALQQVRSLQLPETMGRAVLSGIVKRCSHRFAARLDQIF